MIKILRPDRCGSTALAVVFCNICLAAGPWWEEFPRLVSDSTANAAGVVSNYHGNAGMNANAQDPTWGTFFQRDGISRSTAKIKSFQDAGIKQIAYFETYGQSYCLVAELGAWNETNLTPVLNTYWSWTSYHGGTIRWLGAKDFFDDEVYARPYTRTHLRYGGPPMTYPDGTVATGYNGPDTDPRNSRVYDASCSKDILGNLSIDDYKYSTGPTNGLLYIPKDNAYAGLILFKKDSACPLWTDYTYASTLQAADAGIDGMWTDNYGPWDSFGISAVNNAFGDWSVTRFRGYLTNHFNMAELAGFGVTNTAAFDIREYLKSVAAGLGWNAAKTNLSSKVWSYAEWLNDPLWRAYLIFKRQAGTEALSNYYHAVKSAALAGGKPEFLVAGNDIPGFSLGWARGDLDMVSTELGLGYKNSSGATGFTPPPVGRYAPFYKLAREHAQSRFVNVWLYNDNYTNALSHPELCNVLYYEMLATHTLPKFDPSNSRIAGDEATNAGFFDFVSKAVRDYGNRTPDEDVGIYYSSSSILREMTPKGFIDQNRQPHQFGFWGWATALGELHYQYRAIPEWKLTPELLSTLRVLVIPDADVLDPSDVSSVLVPWVNNGGRLIITGNSGAYLGESGNFALNTNGLSIASLTNLAHVVYLADNIGMDYYLAYSGRPALLAQFGTVMNTVLAGAAPAGVTETTASSRTGITLYDDESSGRVFIDVNNFDINTNTYAVTGTDPLTIEAVLPEWLRGKRLQAFVLSPQEQTPAVEIIDTSDTNRVKISLGSVDYYAGVVVERAREWADPVSGGNWNVATNWLQGLIPKASDAALWRYASGNPGITVAQPSAASSVTAFRSDSTTGYWNTNGLNVLNYGTNTGTLTVDGGLGTVDMWDNGWYGACLYVANEHEEFAADIINAGTVKVRTFQIDTANISSGKSFYTHEAGDLTVQVQIELGGASLSGNEAVFRQVGGTVTVNHTIYGLKLGNGLTKGTYIFDGGTLSVSQFSFAGTNSVFEFDEGTIFSGARNTVWIGTTGGTLRLAGTGDHFFDVAAGQSMTVSNNVTITDKAGEHGTWTKTGTGTLVLQGTNSFSGLLEIKEGTLRAEADDSLGRGHISMEQAVLCLANGVSGNYLNDRTYLILDSSSSVNLGYTGSDTLRALSVDGGETWCAAGIWGAPGTGAEHESVLLSGAGRLNVVTDRIPSTSWSALHFSAEEINAGLADDDADPDGDGYNNYCEFVAGTNPRDKASVLTVQFAPWSSVSNPGLLFNTESGRIYAVYSRTSLLSGAWSLLESNLSGTGGALMIADTNQFPNTFYRLDVMQP